VSADGVRFEDVGTQVVEGDQRNEEVTRTFSFALPASPVRFVRFHLDGTRQLPAWHPSAGGTSWVFVDEIVVK
jgi:hexosaminidase